MLTKNYFPEKNYDERWHGQLNEASPTNAS